MTTDERLAKIEAMLERLLDREPAKEWYSLPEFAKLAGRSVDSVRKWCQSGRVEGVKQQCGYGGMGEWRVSRAEVERYQVHGLRPAPAPAGSRWRG